MHTPSVRIALAAAVLALAGCSITNQSPLVTSLEGVQAATIAAEAAIPILEATGSLSAADATIAMNLAGSVAQSTSQAITEAESTDNAGVKATKIAGIYSSILNSIPGLPVTVSPLVQGILAAILSVEQQFSTAAKLAIVIPKSVTIDSGAKSRLKSVQKSAESTVENVRQWKPSHSSK